jgi:hypothetical protein
VEACNGEDDDCDGETDEDLTRDCSTACGSGTETCRDGRWASCTAPTPGLEMCDGRDNDCDGQTDEDGTPFYRDSDGDTFGDTRVTERACVPPTGYVGQGGDCNDADRAIHPGATETCDGVDQDCTGVADEGCGCAHGTTRSCGDWGEDGPCTLGMQTCTAGAWGECTGGVRPVDETCNMIDDDCDGMTDDHLAGDAYEGHDTCETALSLETVPEGSSREPLRDLPGGASLYDPEGGSDVDWYLIPTVEDSAACIPFTSECCYRFTVILQPPEGDVGEDVRLCVYEGGSCGAFEREHCATALDWSDADDAYVKTVCWSGTCAYEDGKTFRIRVDARDVGLPGCVPYRLRYNFYRIDDECS